MQSLLTNLIQVLVLGFTSLLMHQFITGLFTYTFSGSSSPVQLPQSDNAVFPQCKFATLDWIQPVDDEPMPEVDVVAIAKLPSMNVMKLRELGRQHSVKGASRARKETLVKELRYKMIAV